MNKPPASHDSTNRTCDIAAQDKEVRDELSREIGHARPALASPVYLGRPPSRAQIPASNLRQRD